MNTTTELEKARRDAVIEILTNCAGKYVNPEYYSANLSGKAVCTPQDVINTAISLGVRLLSNSAYESLMTKAKDSTL